MEDVSVLLNLTGKLVLEKTNPLMDLVSGHGPYLYYDRISLERFPLNVGEQEEKVQKLLTRLRNLLGSLRLSVNDKGGTVRLIVTMDLVGRFVRKDGAELQFPVQKVRLFKEMLRRVFSREPQLLERFSYTFIFIEWDSDDKRMAGFYRTLAFDGCFGPEGWLTSEMMMPNAARNQMRDSLKSQSPSIEAPLDTPTVRNQYSLFRERLNNHADSVAQLLAKAGAADAFKYKVNAECSTLKTYGEVCRYDFDELFQSTVGELIGLCSASPDEGRYIIFKMRNDTLINRKKDEMVLCSLLQLLGTMEKEWSQRLAIMDGSMNVHALNAEAVARLLEMTKSCLSKLKNGGEMRWAASEHVAYKVYSERQSKPTENTVHYEYNEEVDEKRKALYDEFKARRRVPFFFGISPGDWKWYNSVLNIMENIFAFEEEYYCPRFISPGRITEKEMDVSTDTATYADLEEKRKTLESVGAREKGRSEGKPGNLLTDLDDLIKGREPLMGDFEKHKKELKKEMLKLGLSSVTFRIIVLICFLISLGYALHFIYSGRAAESLLIGVCFIAVATICGVAALISQRRIKSAITAIFVKIDGCLDGMEQQRQAYLDSINRRVCAQNGADIRRKNLEEIKEKLQRFKSHNMQVELWEKHFAELVDKLKDMLNSLGKVEEPQNHEDKTMNSNCLPIDTPPCLSEYVCREFRTMKVTLSQGQQYNDVTCFLTNLAITFKDKR